MKSTPLVIGNWKMNPLSLSLAQKLASEIKKGLLKTVAQVVVAPPFVYLEAVGRLKGAGGAFTLGAQNVHHEKMGAHTGEISPPMLKNLGVTHVVVGHSERRKEGETDEMVHKKLQAVVNSGMTGVLCVGEVSRDPGAQYLSLIEAQIKKGVANIPVSKLGKIVVAYEPVWAIGTGVNATAADVHEMKLFIERVFSDIYGRDQAKKVRVLYGGSVSGKNARELFEEGQIQGFLVGGASLRAKEFIEIVKATE
jgi:triosephosphate isomerase